MRAFTPDARLMAAASFVREGKTVLDVGTDHGLLPAFLLLSDRCPCAVCTDIGSEPLSHAAATAAKYGLEDRMELCLSDGFDAVAPFAAQDIVIAGMGGDLMAKILARPAWIRSRDTHLILQPQSHPEAVRSFLNGTGFNIKEETAVRSGGFTYLLISVFWDGAERPADEVFNYFGLLPSLGTPEAAELIRREKALLTVRRDSLVLNGHIGPESENLDKILKEAGNRGI